MADDSAGSPQCWTAKRRASLILSILKGETSAQAAARNHGLTMAEAEERCDRFLLGAENAVTLAPRGSESGRCLRMAHYVRGQSLPAGRAPPEGASVAYAPRLVPGPCPPDLVCQTRTLTDLGAGCHSPWRRLDQREQPRGPRGRLGHLRDRWARHEAPAAGLRAARGAERAVERGLRAGVGFHLQMVEAPTLSSASLMR